MARQNESIPRTLNQRSMIRLLEQHGWTKSHGGKHDTKMVKQGCRPVTLPQHRNQDYSPRLRLRILKEAGIPIVIEIADENVAYDQEGRP